jgi:hypothetical protein
MLSKRTERVRDVDVIDDAFESAPTERMSRAAVMQQSATIAAEFAILAQNRQTARTSRGTNMARTDDTDPSLERLATGARGVETGRRQSPAPYDPQLMDDVDLDGLLNRLNPPGPASAKAAVVARPQRAARDASREARTVEIPKVSRARALRTIVKVVLVVSLLICAVATVIAFFRSERAIAVSPRVAVLTAAPSPSIVASAPVAATATVAPSSDAPPVAIPPSAHPRGRIAPQSSPSSGPPAMTNNLIQAPL